MDTATVVLYSFPARVQSDAGTRDQAAVVSDGTRAWAVVARAGAVEVVATMTVASGWPENPMRSYTLVGADGETWQVTPGGGCGCGSLLKRYTGASLLALVAQ